MRSDDHGPAVSCARPASCHLTGWDGYLRTIAPLATVAPMASPILLCTDGSDLALRALSAGLDLVGRGHEVALISVMDLPGEASLIGSGHVGPDMSLEEYNNRVGAIREAAESAIEEAQRELDLVTADVHLVSGEPGAEICALASEISARAIVIGSRGRGGLKRLVLGSVSDHVVRHAPCTVVVTRT
jgi:nucleotide-binding universal stress UspA family protein